MKEITQFANGISKFSRLRRLVLFLSSKYRLKHDISRGGGSPVGRNFLGCFFGVFLPFSQVFSKVKKNTAYSTL